MPLSADAIDALDIEPIQSPRLSPQEIDAIGAAPASSALRRYVADPAIWAAKGVVGVPEGIVGLADIPTFGAAGKVLEAGGYGFQPKFTKEWLSRFESPETRAARERVSKAEGFFPKVATALQNPSSIVSTVVESVPSMLGGAAIGRQVLKQLPKVGAIVGAATGEGAVTAGQTAEQLRQESDSGFITPKQSALALTTGALTGLIGVAGGGLARRLGIQDVDVLLAKGTSEATKKGILRRVAEGALTEGALEELPQSAQERVQHNIASNKPWNEGVAEDAALGMLAGGFLGGLANVASGRPATTQEKAADETIPSPGITETTAEIQEAGSALTQPGISPQPASEKGATQPESASPALKILKARGVADDVANAVAESVGPKLADETGEAYRARVNQAHDNAGFKVRKEVVGGISEAEKRRVLEAQGETPEGIEQAIAEDRDRLNAIDADNQTVLAGRVIRVPETTVLGGTGRDLTAVQPLAVNVQEQSAQPRPIAGAPEPPAIPETATVPKQEPSASPALTAPVAGQPEVPPVIPGEPDRVRTQVQGTPIGVEREAENIAAIQQAIRTNIFDGTQPPSDTATTQARTLLNRLTDPKSKAGAAGEILSTTNAEMGPGLVLAELWRYAEKMVLTNSDDSFLRSIVPHYQDFALSGEAGAGSTTFGRGLRALQETDTLFRQLYEIEKEKRAAAGQQMAVGPELLDALLAALKGEAPVAEVLERKTRTVLGTKVPKDKVEEIVRVVNANPADPVTELINHFAQLAGIKNVTPEQHRQLVELAQKLADPNLSIPERSELLDQMYSVFNTMKLPPSLLTRLASNLVATNLTGLRTLGVNIFSPNVQGLVELGLTGITSPRDFPAMLKGAIEGGKQWLENIRYSMGRDAYSFLNNDYQAAQNVLKQIWQRGLVQIKSKSLTERSRGLANLIFGAQQYYMRLLNSVDNANAVLRRQMQMSLYTSQAMHRLEMSAPEIRTVTEMFYLMRDQFYGQAIESGRTENQARIRANALAYQEFVNFLNGELPSDSMGQPVGSEIAKAANYEAVSVIGRLAEGIEEINEGGLITRSFGAPILHLSNWMRKQPGLMPAIGVAMLGYVNVPYRTARYYAWNTPYGLVRFGINKWRKSNGKELWWKQSLATEFQEQQRFKNALAGSAVLAALTGLGIGLIKTSASDGAGDDEDDGVYFTGDGPRNKNLKSAWLSRGFKPQSLVLFLNGKPVSVEMSRSGESLAHFGWMLAARDDRAWREKETAATNQEYKPTATKEAAYAIGTYAGLLGQRGFLQTLTQAGNVAAGRSDPTIFAASKGGSFSAGLVTPFLGLQRTVQGLLIGPVETSSVQAAFMANWPVLNIAGINHPKINSLADKLYNPDNAWYHKMRETGIPVAFSTNPTTENKKIYGLLVEKGVAPSELRRSTVEDKYGPLTDDKFAQFAEKSGRLTKQQLVNNEPMLRNMSPEGVKKWLNGTTGNAQKLTAIGMNLEPVTPAKTRAKAAPSILPEPAIYRAAAPPARRSYGRIRSSFGSRKRLTGGRVRRSLSLKVPRLKRSRIRGVSSRRKGYGRVRASVARRRKIYA